MKKLLITGIAVSALLWSCQPGETVEENNAPTMPPGLDLAQMDTTVNPRKDFYRFANGSWLDNTEIPGDEGRWGGFPELREKNDNVMLEIMQSAAENPEFKEGSDERKALDFFAVGMDSVLAERAGVGVLSDWLARINGIETKDDLQSVIAEMHRSGYGPFNGVSAFPNLMNSKINSLYIVAGGLGLPNRDYYTKTDKKSVDIRDKYVKHIERMLSLADVPGDPMAMAANIMALENRLALATLTPIEARNIPALYNPYPIDQLPGLMPQMNWNEYFTSVGVDLSRVDTVIVTEPKFIKEMGAVMDEVSLEDIKAYLTWNVVNRASSFLNNEMVQSNFDFYGKVIQGTEEMRPRKERVLSTTNGVIGEAIGKVYVAETFPPEAKQKAEEMVGYLKKAFEKRIKNLEWMSDSSKQQALKKLENMTVKIGYPNKWKDYSELRVENSGEKYSFFNNMENAWKWQFADNIKDVGEPVDKEEWGMNPQTVNAYFNPLNNEIVFPAAILQPPFYNYTADEAVNYGGMGAVIGHEISHGFDDQGSRFDWEGNMVNWWTEEDRRQFDERSAKLVAQFDRYEALDSVFVQGKLTLGENIGDLGGLNAAYDALQMYLEDNGRPGLIDGFTPEQRFFISWATIWRTKYRDEYLRTQVLTDPHSPGMFRAVGPLTNMETFYQAFGIEEGDELWLPEEERVKIW